MKTGQIALEFLLIITVALAIIGPLFYFTFAQSSDDIKVSKAQSAVDTVGRSVDYVYSLNKGSVVRADIDVPEGIVGYNITNKTIIYRVGISVGITYTFYTTKANLSGTLPTTEGRHMIIINNTGGAVSIA